MSILEHFTIDLSDTSTGEATIEAKTDDARRAFACYFGRGAVSVNIPVANIENLLNSMFPLIWKWEGERAS